MYVAGRYYTLPFKSKIRKDKPYDINKDKDRPLMYTKPGKDKKSQMRNWQKLLIEKDNGISYKNKKIR